MIVYLYSTNEYYQVVVKTWFDYFSNKSLVLSDEDLFTPFESKRKLFALIANSSFQKAVKIVFHCRLLHLMVFHVTSTIYVYKHACRVC